MKLFKKLKRKPKKPKIMTPKDGAIYAITDGNYKGQFVVFVENKDHNYGAIAFPEMELHIIPENDVKDGLQKGIIDYVEHLPDELYKLVCAEYNHRTSLNVLHKEAKQEDNESNS